MTAHPLVNEQKQLILPPELARIFVEKLKAMDKYEEASKYTRKEDDEGPIGGDTLEATEEHFCTRFSNSCVRLQYVMIDPDKKFVDAASQFSSSFYNGEVCLVDIPCGTGAGSLSLLHTLCDLRDAGLAPPTKLKVHIYAADYSNHVSGILSHMIDASLARFTACNIHVTYEIHHWDAFDITSTSNLVDNVKAIKCNEYFILVSAFNGVGHDNYQEIKPSLDLIQGSFANQNFTLIHVEPSSNKGMKFLKSIAGAVTTMFKGKIFSKILNIKPRFEWVDPVNDRVVQSSVSVHLNTRNE
ncbi:hypothetical protein AB4440_14435 [Vibrio splendidus]|uniref:hypothetical protein n=1 Tax=Vibrio TaxID=662 RepID=UPI000C866F2D|nr:MULTISPECIES: hypothetical protein [Vibrio]MCC4879041.1 hypothetical protein [Vibrio splendidus]PMO95001.1 hypothetical protein BCS97_15370 [Vibrio splendidus]PMP24834.1 hypothetical protein BCS89_15210 [Vibrio splendidus]PMP32191.1 hypothetical protein BCS88_15770 [Vibrio splendidus]PMP45500.1 hypothetical protein BCS85_17070 [Vibrio splendidus]